MMDHRQQPNMMDHRQQPNMMDHHQQSTVTDHHQQRSGMMDQLSSMEHQLGQYGSGCQAADSSYIPKLPIFSGLERDAVYARWIYEVRCLQYTRIREDVLLNLVHRSLKTPAADVLMHGDGSLRGTLAKLDARYGSVMSGDTIMTKIYSEPQRHDETCVQWASRLENLVYMASEKKVIDITTVPQMLTSRFWAGLCNVDIKNALRSTKENTSIDELVMAARAIEDEFGQPQEQKKQPAQYLQQTENTEIEKLKKDFEQMKKMMETLVIQKADAFQQVTSVNRGPVKCHQCNEVGHLAFGCRQGTNITCHRCQKIGHVARSCRPLNSQ